MHPLFILGVILLLYFYQESRNSGNHKSGKQETGKREAGTKLVSNECVQLKFEKQKDIRKLTRQGARWLVAAEQDNSPLIATLHVQYGMGYLWALKDIASPSEFFQATGLDFEIFEAEAVQVQDRVSSQILKVCPGFAGNINVYLSSIAGER